MDIIGVYAVAMITAFGGGSLRDVILNRHPLFWIEHYGYTVLLLALSIVTVLVIRNFFAMNKFVKAVVVLDALGWACSAPRGVGGGPAREQLVHLGAPRGDDGRVRRRDARHHLQRDPPRLHPHRTVRYVRVRRGLFLPGHLVGRRERGRRGHHLHRCNICLEDAGNPV